MSSTKPVYLKSNILKNSKQFQTYEEFKIVFKQAGAAISLSGVTPTMTFRKDSIEGPIVKELVNTTDLEIITESGTDKVRVKKFSIDEPGTIYYDLRLNFTATSKVKYYVGGKVEIDPVATKQDG